MKRKVIVVRRSDTDPADDEPEEAKMFYEDSNYESRRDSFYDFPEDIETSRLRYIMEIYDVSEEEARRIIDEG